MPTKVQYETVNQCLQTIAQALLGLANSSGVRGWKTVVLDARFAGDRSGAFFDKCRVHAARGTPKGVQTSTDITTQLIALWEMPAAVFNGRWYGVKVTVTRAGECQVEYDYDRKCADDPSFFQS